MTSALAWLGVVVLHATWLGVAAAAIVAIALRWLGVDRPRGRHAVALAALLAVPPAAILAALAPTLVATPVQIATVPMTALAAMPGAGAVDTSFSVSIAPAVPWLGFIWLLGAAWGLLGLAVASGRLARLRRAARPIADDEAERLLARARQRLDHRGPVALATSREVTVPTLIGWRQPLIVVPAAMLGELPDDELEWLLVHELAHVQRRDVAWSWVQALVEVALFFHPAAHWLARHVRHERECCCDAVIPPRQGDLVAYVRALTRLAAADRSALRPALSASGGTLVNRIERLVDPAAVIPTCSRTLCLALVLGAVAGAAAVATFETEDCPQVEPIVVAENSAEAAAQSPAADVKTPGGAPGVKYIDWEGNEVSPVGPDGKPRMFGSFTDEHGQDFAVLLGPEWQPKPEAPPRKRPEAPIPFLDVDTGDAPMDTDGC